MKKLILNISLSVLMVLSFSAFAEKVVITGQPVMLEDHDGVYHLPAGYTTTGTYHYVTIGGTNRVCYLETQPTLTNLQPMTVNVLVEGKSVAWNCYESDPMYFEVTAP